MLGLAAADHLGTTPEGPIPEKCMIGVRGAA